jgi:hypothetical protein
MDGIEGSDLGGLKRASGIEDTVIYTDHVESAEHRSAASEPDFALEEQGSKDLGAGESARH